MIRIEADAIQNTEHEVLRAPIRLITNQSRIRVTLKRRVRIHAYLRYTPSNSNIGLNVQNWIQTLSIFVSLCTSVCISENVCSTHSSTVQLWALRAAGIYFSVGSLNFGSWLEGFILVAFSYTHKQTQTKCVKLVQSNFVQLNEIHRGFGAQKIWVLKSFINLDFVYVLYVLIFFIKIF